MNVLIHSPSPSPNVSSLQNLLHFLLSPHYAVQFLTSSELIAPDAPWMSGCALLILPGGELGMGLRGKVAQAVRRFLEGGGRALGLGLGTRGHTSGGSGLNLGHGLVFGAREEEELKFTRPGGGYVYPTWPPSSSSVSSSSPNATPFVPIRIKDYESVPWVYRAQAPAIDMGEGVDMDVLAWSENRNLNQEESESDPTPTPEAILLSLGPKGAGKLAIWRAELSCPIDAVFSESNSSTSHALNSSTTSSSPVYHKDLSVSDLERDRLTVLRYALDSLGLVLPENKVRPSSEPLRSSSPSPPSPSPSPSPSPASSPSTSPLPQFLVSSPSRPGAVADVLEALGVDCAPHPSSDDQVQQEQIQLSEHERKQQPNFLKDANDDFLFYVSSDPTSYAYLLARERERGSGSGSGGGEGNSLAYGTHRESHQNERRDPDPKRVFSCLSGTSPPPALTPLFDSKNYFEALREQKALRGLGQSVDKAGKWELGDVLLYGEVVTSTQTMLDRNPHLLTNLPPPLLSLASYQLSGRGRGANAWLSPPGCLQFSIKLRLDSARVKPARIVFIQYLAALAIVQAIRRVVGVGGSGNGAGEAERLRIKWPNDLYVVHRDRDAGAGMSKVGGVLVNTSFGSGGMDVVVGCGVNLTTPPPIPSLAQHLFPPSASDSNCRQTLSPERTMAAIAVEFELMLAQFVEERGSFASFEELYLERWLHSDQLVTLTTTNPPRAVRIVGITPDYGLLRTVPERNGWSRGAKEEFIDLQPDGNSFDLMKGLIKAKT